MTENVIESDRWHSLLPVLIPLATSWAKEQESNAQVTGHSLTPEQSEDARDVGVNDWGRIRLCLVEEMPAPTHALLAEAARMTGLLTSNTAGLTLGHAVFIRDKVSLTQQLLRHEFRHVAQYEQAGSIENFLMKYFDQVLRVGYRNAPYEIDARQHETASILYARKGR